MPAVIDYDSLAKKWNGTKRDKQQQATPDLGAGSKYDIAAKRWSGVLQPPATGGIDTSPVAPTLESLAPPQDNKEGVYRMKDKSGKEYPVTFSNVEKTDDFRNSFVDEKEAQRYEKDLSASTPSHWENLRQHVYKLTDPTPHGEGKWYSQHESDVALENILKRTGKTLFGIADMGPQYYNAVRDMLSSDPEKSAKGESEVWAFHPGSQIVNRIKEFHQDYKKDPNLAFENSAGDALGAFIADKVQGGVMKAPGKIASMVNSTAKEMAGINPASAAEFVNKAMEENAKAKTDAAQKNAENAQKHMEATQEALHQTKGAELEHQRAMRQAQDVAEEANKKAAQEHLEATQKALHETAGKELQTEVERHAAERKAVEENQKAHREHLEATHKALMEEKEVAEANHKAAQEHLETTQKALENQKKAEALTTKSLKMKDKIYPRFKVIQEAAKRYFNKKYNDLETATEGKTAPLHVLADAVYDAKLDKIEGSDTKQAIFDDILKKAKGELGAGEVAGRPENYDELAEDEKRVIDRGGAGDIGQGVSYKDLRGYDRELGKVIGSPSTAADVRQAAIHVQKVIREMQQDIADRTGPAIGKLNANIRRQYQNYAETMLESTGGKASAAAKALREGDADSAIHHFEGMTPFEQSRAISMLRGVGDEAQWVSGERPPVSESLPEGRGKTNQRLRTMRNYREDTAGMLREYLETQRQKAALEKENATIPNRPKETSPRTEVPDRPQEVQPSHIEPKPRTEVPDRPAPVEPKPIAQPDRTAPLDRPVEVKPETKQVGEEELTEANRKQYDDTVKKLRSRGIWYGTALSWLRVGRDLLNLKLGDAALNAVGAGVSTVGTIVGLNKLTEYLERPGVRDWVAKPSVEEIRQLNRLPTEQRKIVAQGLQNVRLATTKNGDKASPLITAFIVANAPKSKPNAQQTPKENDALEGVQP